MKRFILLFLAMAIIAMASIWMSDDVSTQYKLLANGIVVALGVWYWFVGHWPIVRSDFQAVIFLIGNLVGVVALIRIWDGNGLLLFAAYWFGFAYLRVIPALVYSVVLTLASQWGFGTFGESSLSINQSTLGSLGLLLIVVVFSGFMARYIEAFHEESEKNRRLLKELEAAQAALAHREREAGIEDERRRLAGEIHDTIAQQFTSVITNLQAAENTVTRDPETAKTHVTNAFSAATQGLSDCRALLSTMQPDVLSGRTLQDALQETVDAARAQNRFSLEFRTDGMAQALERPIEALLVRALQESIRNIAKHARATNVAVTLSWLEDEVLLDIEDDGVGFDPTAIVAGQSGHRMGLLTMEQRVERAGGTFALESTPGEGTSIAVSFPTGDQT